MDFKSWTLRWDSLVPSAMWWSILLVHLCDTVEMTMQGCNFVKFSRGHVGSLIKYFRSPQEYLRAHNEIEFIFKSKNAETVKLSRTTTWCKILIVHGFSCAMQPETFTLFLLLMYMITWTSLLHCSWILHIYVKQIINANIIYPWILVAKWATSFWFLVVHRQHLVALGSGRPVICNPAMVHRMKTWTRVQVRFVQKWSNPFWVSCIINLFSTCFKCKTFVIMPFVIDGSLECCHVPGILQPRYHY